MASIKYKDNGTYKDIVVKVGDTLPIGAIIGFDTTQTIPDGWEYYAENQIKKIAPVTPANGNIKNSYGNSQTDTYSQEYKNEKTLGTSLYSNSSGTHTAFTLSEDIKHFREIEITFGRSSWTNMKQKLRVVPQQSGTTPIGLIALYPTTDGNSLVLASAVFEIGSSGTNATFPRNTSGTIGSTGFVKDTSTYVNVYEVVGYK